eukprot:6471042-Amphidinium_carterae.1
MKQPTKLSIWCYSDTACKLICSGIDSGSLAVARKPISRMVSCCQCEACTWNDFQEGTVFEPAWLHGEDYEANCAQTKAAQLHMLDRTPSEPDRLQSCLAFFSRSFSESTSSTSSVKAYSCMSELSQALFVCRLVKSSGTMVVLYWSSYYLEMFVHDGCDTDPAHFQTRTQ